MAPSDVFSADDFLSQAVEGVGSTTITPIPQGNAYMALIGQNDDAIKVASYDRTDGKPGKIHTLNIRFELLDEGGQIRASIDGRDPIHTESYFLDVTPDGKLDMGKGKNVKLNRLREALDQNDGRPWSPNQLRGAGPVLLSLGVQPDKKDKSLMRNYLKAVGKPGTVLK